jgi:hypothetical protein
LEKIAKRWRWFGITISVICALLVAATIVLSTRYAKRALHYQNSTPTINLTVTNSLYSDTVPVIDSRLGAATVILGNLFPPLSSWEPETKLAYNNGNKICIRVKSESSWHHNVQCVEGLNPLPNTPLTMLDWIGGPSIYFFTADFLLSGIDYVPFKDSWRFSSVINNKIRVHNQSQIASATWQNGTSVWIKYQDPDEHLREFGMDDYRDQSWRDSDVGALDKIQVGSGIGVCRWLNGTDEVEEVFFLQGGILHGRIYAKLTWEPEVYGIEGAPSNLPDGTSITATLVNETAGNTVLLAYVTRSGFLNVQTRETKDLPTSKCGSFSSANELVEGSGHSQTGLTAIGSWGGAEIIFVNSQTVLELTNSNSTSPNWTTITI